MMRVLCGRFAPSVIITSCIPLFITLICTLYEHNGSKNVNIASDNFGKLCIHVIERIDCVSWVSCRNFSLQEIRHNLVNYWIRIILLEYPRVNKRVVKGKASESEWTRRKPPGKNVRHRCNIYSDWRNEGSFNTNSLITLIHWFKSLFSKLSLKILRSTLLNYSSSPFFFQHTYNHFLNIFCCSIF